MMNLAGVHLGDEVSLRGIRDIVFPEHNDDVPQVAIDIGGSLVKVAYFTRHGSALASLNASLNGAATASHPPSPTHAPAPAPATVPVSALPPPSMSSVHTALVTVPIPVAAPKPAPIHTHPAAVASVAATGSETGSGRGSPSNGHAGGGRLNFAVFETAKIDECIAFLKLLLEEQAADHAAARAAAGNTHVPEKMPPRTLLATGGGAHKFHDLLTQELGVTILKYDEMECLVKGLNFLVKYVPMEIFTYAEPVKFETTPPEEAYPYMLVNIGSGVSILKVTGPDQSERVSGTSLGGGTYWGLMSMLGSQSGMSLSFDDMLELAKSGDNANVDMLVGDIYGMDYNKIGLRSTTIASTFGKVFKKTPEEQAALKLDDISRSLLFMVSNNLGQIAYLNARAHGINRIYFGGYFICGHPVTMHTLSYAIQFWSQGSTKALFLRHEGFLGAVGAFLQHQ